MFSPAISAPTDGRPILWLYADGSGATVMFAHQGEWWEWDECWVGAPNPYDSVESMIQSDWLWVDLPPAQIARSMRVVLWQKEVIDKHLSLLLSDSKDAQNAQDAPDEHLTP